MQLLARSLRAAGSLASATSSSSAGLLRPTALAAQQQQQQRRAYAVPAPRDPAAFLASIARPPKRPDLSGDANVIAALTEGSRGDPENGPKTVKSVALKKAGVQVSMRRFLLWALQMSSLGVNPKDFPPPKPKKLIRRWGPRVQNGIRVRGRKRPGEK